MKQNYFALATLTLLAAVLPAAAQIEHANDVQITVRQTSETPQAVVLSVDGKCEYSEDGKAFQALKAGHVFNQGAVVRTGENARTDLFFRRIGTTVRLQAGTEIKLEKMARSLKDGLPVLNTLLDLRTGRIFTVVRSLVPGSTLEIRNAAGRAVVEGGGGNGRYIITADGTHVAAKDSAVPLKVVAETGITVITPGQKFSAKDGKLFPADSSVAVEEFIDLDEVQALAEELTGEMSRDAKTVSQALVLATGPNATFSHGDGVFQKLRPGHVLTQGAVLRTGDDTIIDLFLRRWGTTVRLFPNTELALEKMAKNTAANAPALETTLNLPQGRIFCFIRIPVAAAKFEVKTLLGRTQLQSAGAGRYDIRANGTIVTGKSSFAQLKVITKNGVTTIAPGQTFTAEDGHLTPSAPSDLELLVIQMDELESIANELSPAEVKGNL